MPSAVGYQPTLQTEMGELQERITSTKKGSITSVQAIYVPADDYTDPAPATTFAHLDATTNLSRQIVELGIYPAVDPLASSSRILDPRIIGEEHYDVARAVKQVLQRYKDLQDIIAILGIDELSEEDKLTWRARARSRSSSRSPSTWPSSSPASPASTCPLEDTVRSFKMIVDGELDDLPEQAFYMAGAIEDVLRAGQGDAGLGRAMPLPTKLALEIVTPEGLLLRDEVDEVDRPRRARATSACGPATRRCMATLGVGRALLPQGAAPGTGSPASRAGARCCPTG